MRYFDLNDDYGPVIDQTIFAAGIRDSYKKEGSFAWILKIDDEFIREALMNLNEKQIAIIEIMFFEGGCLGDICNKYAMTHDEALDEIKTMKITLVRYM